MATRTVKYIEKGEPAKIIEVLDGITSPTLPEGVSGQEKVYSGKAESASKILYIDFAGTQSPVYTTTLNGALNSIALDNNALGDPSEIFNLIDQESYGELTQELLDLGIENLCLNVITDQHEPFGVALYPQGTNGIVTIQGTVFGGTARNVKTIVDISDLAIGDLPAGISDNLDVIIYGVTESMDNSLIDDKKGYITWSPLVRELNEGEILSIEDQTARNDLIAQEDALKASIIAKRDEIKTLCLDHNSAVDSAEPGVEVVFDTEAYDRLVVELRELISDLGTWVFDAEAHYKSRIDVNPTATKWTAPYFENLLEFYNYGNSVYAKLKANKNPVDPDCAIVETELLKVGDQSINMALSTVGKTSDKLELGRLMREDQIALDALPDKNVTLVDTLTTNILSNAFLYDAINIPNDVAPAPLADILVNRKSLYEAELVELQADPESTQEQLDFANTKIELINGDIARQSTLESDRAMIKSLIESGDSEGIKSFTMTTVY